MRTETKNKISLYSPGLTCYLDAKTTCITGLVSMQKMLKHDKYTLRIHHVQDYISSHLDDDLTLEKCARIAHFSPFYFHRIFKSVTDETFYNFVQRTRLERGQSMLAGNPDMKIITIAMHCGFSSHAAFSKAFKQHFQESPSAYRWRIARLNSNNAQEKSKNGKTDSKSNKAFYSSDDYISDDELEILYNRRKKMNPRIQTLPPYRIAYMRRIGAYGSENVQVMQKLKKWAITRDLLTPSSIILSIAHDDPKITAPENCRYDAGIVISKNYQLESGMNESRLPSGLYAMLQVEHTVEAIQKAWSDIFSIWLPESGYQMDMRPFFERYLGTAADLKIKPETCEICIPVRSL